MARRRIFQARVADDLIRAIYDAEGWQRHDRGGFRSCSARCNAFYAITADPRRNRYVAIRKDVHP